MGMSGDRNTAARRRFLQALGIAALGPLVPSRSAATGARVVIAGGGFGGGACALALRRLDPAIDVTLVDPGPDYVTGPLSNTALVGWRSLASITVTRAGLQRAGVHVVRDRVAGFDPVRRSLRLAGGDALGYERLVVAPGIRLLWNTPAGYDEAAAQQMPHAWIPGEQTALLAARLQAMDDGGVVAISVPGGLIRCPPGPFERATLIAAWMKQHRPRSKVLILDANNRFPRQPFFTDAWRTHYPGMIEWVPSTEGGTVEHVDVGKSTLYTPSGAHRVAVANVIPAQAAGQLAVDGGLASGHGWCEVAGDTFESTQVAGVHVIGDACAAGAMPKAASSAVSQAARCAAAIVSALRGSEPGRGTFESTCYSYLARDRALAIHGRFAIEDGRIEALPLPSPTRAPSATEEAQLAERWYRRIVAEAFGA